MELLIEEFLIHFPFILSLILQCKLSIESSKGIYSIYLFTFPFLIINIITNDFPIVNQLNKCNNYINLGDLIVVLGSIDFVLGSIDLSDIIGSFFRRSSLDPSIFTWFNKKASLKYYHLFLDLFYYWIKSECINYLIHIYLSIYWF